MEIGPRNPSKKIESLMKGVINNLLSEKSQFGFEDVKYYEHSVGIYTPKDRAIQIFFKDPILREIKVSVFMKLEGDEDELIFSEMTTLPSDARRSVNKYGQRSIDAILKFLKTKKSDFKFIRATQVSASGGFWSKCGFFPLNNITKDFELDWNKFEA